MGQIQGLRKHSAVLIVFLVMIAGCSTSSSSIRIDTLGVTSLDFGQVHVFDSKELSFEIYCRSKKPLHIEKMEMQTGTDFSITKVLNNADVQILSPYSIELQKNERITVFVSFAPLSISNLSDNVLIFHDAKNESSHLEISCVGEGITPIVSQIKITPSNHVDFGTVKIRMNQIYEAVVEIENIGFIDLLINEIKVETGTEFTIYEVLDNSGNALPVPFNTTIKAGEKVTVKIRFNPPAIKSFTDKLIIKHDATNETNPYIVNLKGVGIAPIISVKDTKILSTNGGIRASGYPMGNRIITGGGKVFVTWLESTAEAKITSYDTTTNSWGSTYTVGTLPVEKSGPVMTMDSNGNIYFVYGPNNYEFISTRTVAPYDISTWQRTHNFGSYATYPSLVIDKNDTVHCAYKGGYNPQGVMIQTYTNVNAWSSPTEIVNCAYNTSVTQYGNSLAVSPNGDLHLGFHILDDNLVTAGKSAGYLRSKDGGINWESADGTPVSLPATPSTNCYFEQGNNLDMRVNNVAIDDKGNPWLSVTHYEGNPTLKLWHYENNSWQMIDLVPELQKHIPGDLLTEGTLTFDDTGMLYVVATTITPGYVTHYGDASHEVVLFASADYGKTFQFLQISQNDPNLPNWIPSIERPYGPNPIGVPNLMYIHGDRAFPPSEVIFKSLQKQ